MSNDLGIVPEVTVVIPCRNESRFVEPCLRSIFSQVGVRGGFEVVVADGMSDDDTWERLMKLQEQDCRLRAIRNPGKIVSTGLNAAIEHARAKIIVRMDVHSEYAPDYIQKCVLALRSTGADNVGGPWIAQGSSYLSRAIAAAFQCRWVVGGARGHDVHFEGQVDTVYLGCWYKQAFSTFGAFDEDLVRNQDDEFNLRICRNGGRIWQSPNIRSCYRPRNSLGALARQFAQYGYWKVRVIQKHRLPASWRHLIPGAFVLSILICSILAAFSPIWLYVLGLACVCYLLFNFGASFESAKAKEWLLLPVLPVVIACMQLGYGAGFLVGLWNFILMNRRTSTTFAKLTRLL